MTVRGGGIPTCFLGFDAEKQNGPRRFGALPPDAHGCIMVWVIGPTEYKVAARLPRARRAWAPLGSVGSLVRFVMVYEVDLLGDWECSASRLALARARFAAYGLDPSAFPVRRWPHHSVGVLRRRSAPKSKKESGEYVLDNLCPIQGNRGPSSLGGAARYGDSDVASCGSVGRSGRVRKK